MEKTNRVFGKVINIDEHLLSGRIKIGPLSMRGRGNKAIFLLTLENRLITIVNEEFGCGPDFIQCEKLPGNEIELPDDGWVISDGLLKVPFCTQLSLFDKSKYDSYQLSSLTDFPGHLEIMVSRSLRDCEANHELDLRARLSRLNNALFEYLTESTEIPVLDVIGFGQGILGAGDAALCGMILTAKCFNMGGRCKVTWLNRLKMEIRRFLHKTNSMGKNWLMYALEGRVTEGQKSFFKAMADDFECADEIVVKNTINNDILNGKSFLIGVHTALGMIRERFF